MPRYLHIPHTPDTARALTLSGRNCLVVSGIVAPLKPATGAEKGAEAKCVHKARPNWYLVGGGVTWDSCPEVIHIEQILGNYQNYAHEMA